MKRRGFTLIELLVVLTVLGILMGLLMPLLAIAQRAAKKSATRSVMVKVDTGLRLFRAEIGSYPWQQSYADLAAGDPWTNRLYYHIGTNIDPTHFNTAVRKDADDAAELYDVSTAVNLYQFTGTDGDNDGIDPIMLNRMAAERARLAILAGNTGIKGPVLLTPFIDSYSLVVIPRRVMPITPLVGGPLSVAAPGPGWAKDYLRGELESRYILDQAVLDAWKRPLIYVGQVVEGMTSAKIMGRFMQIRSVDFGLEPLGRKSLADKDAITGKALTADPVYLPDIANLRHSDRRYYAAPGLELEFELWSAGPDGRADWMRDGRANEDNLPLIPYDKKIP